MRRYADVTAVVLCGGRGSRAGGRDKPLVPIDGVPMIERVIAVIEPQTAAVLISANRNRDRYAEHGRVVADQLDGFQGPLAGIHACLALCATRYVYVCPGDAPYIVPEVLDRLHAAAAPRNSPIVCATDGSRRQHLHLMFDANLGAALETYLATGNRRVADWVAASGVEGRRLQRPGAGLT